MSKQKRDRKSQAKDNSSARAAKNLINKAYQSYGTIDSEQTKAGAAE